MDIIRGVHDCVNPVPLLWAVVMSNTIRMSVIKILLISAVFIYSVTFTIDNIVEPILQTYLPLNIYGLLQRVLRRAPMIGFAIVPPMAAADFKKDIISLIKTKERSKRTTPRKPSLLETIEKIIFIQSLTIIISVLVGGWINTLIECCLCAYYLMEPRWLNDGIGFRQMFQIVEARWLYMAVLGCGQQVITYLLQDTTSKLLAVSVWQVMAAYNGWTGWAEINHNTAIYPRLPLFTMQASLKSMLVKAIQRQGIKRD